VLGANEAGGGRIPCVSGSGAGPEEGWFPFYLQPTCGASRGRASSKEGFPPLVWGERGQGGFEPPVRDEWG